MRFFKMLFAKKRFPDGSVLWPSGKEHFSFLDRHGSRFEFDVLYTSAFRNAINIVVEASLTAADGTLVSQEIKGEVFSKIRAYFSERGQQVEIV